MKDILIAIPAYRSLDREDVNEMRRTYVEGFRHLSRHYPVLVIGMNFTDIDRAQWSEIGAYVVEIDPSPSHIARYVGNAVAIDLGFNYVYWGDDDLRIREGSAEEIHTGIQQISITNKRVWLASSYSYLATGCNKKETILTIARKTNDKCFFRDIPRNSLITDHDGWDRGFCTREGIISRPQDYFVALNVALNDPDKTMHKKFAGAGEDCILLSYLACHHGISLMKTHNIKHITYVRRYKRFKGKTSHSTIFGTVPSPSRIAYKQKTPEVVIQQLRDIEGSIPSILDSESVDRLRKDME